MGIYSTITKTLFIKQLITERELENENKWIDEKSIAPGQRDATAIFEAIKKPLVLLGAIAYQFIKISFNISLFYCFQNVFVFINNWSCL